MNNGKHYTIIDYIRNNYIIVQDNYGNTRTTNYSDFKRGKVG